MKHFPGNLFKVLLFAACISPVVFLVSSFSGDDAKYPGGAPAGYTGSPADGKDCKQCHGGSTTPVTDWITSNIPAEGYTPGTTYDITVTVTGSGKKGFEVSPQNLSGSLLGTLQATSGTKLTGSGKYITQTSSSNSNPATWTFNWTAPVAGTGEVTFYGAFTVSKAVTKTSTLTVQEVAQTFTVNASAQNSTICQGASTTLSATPTGAPGTVEYLWTSDPAGFTSTEQSPVVSPLVNTTYTVTATSASQTATDAVSVEVIICSGIGQTAGNQTADIRYNRLTSALEVNGNPETTNELTATLYQADGRLIGKFRSTGNGTVTIPRSKLPSGLLIVKVQSGENTLTRKVIIP